MQDDRQVVAARQFQLLGQEMALARRVQAGLEAVDADLAHRHPAGIVARGRQHRVQPCQRGLGLGCAGPQRMQAQRIGLAGALGQMAQRLEMLGGDRRQHQAGDAP